MNCNYDDSVVEKMIEVCVSAIDLCELTEWEMDFINDLDDKKDSFHFSKKQIEKLEDIHEKVISDERYNNKKH